MAVSGIVSTGICVIAFGHMQVPGDIMGFYGVKRDRGGQLKTRNSLVGSGAQHHRRFVQHPEHGSVCHRQSPWRNGRPNSTAIRPCSTTPLMAKGAVSMPTNAVKFTVGSAPLGGAHGESLVVGLEFTSKAMAYAAASPSPTHKFVSCLTKVKFSILKVGLANGVRPKVRATSCTTLTPMLRPASLEPAVQPSTLRSR